MEKIVKWVEKYKDTATLILTFLGVVGALVGLFLLVSQTHSLEKQTQLLSEQYKASSRPYLAVEDIATQQENGSSIRILIHVKNHGQVPATKVELQEVIIGGADIKYDEKTGTYTFIYTGKGTENSPETTTVDNETGVSITVSGGYVTALVDGDYPPDFVFFPGKEQVVIATVHAPTYEATVSDTKVMHIGLTYSWGLERYYYVAKATLQDNMWKVVESRGN